MRGERGIKGRDDATCDRQHGRILADRQTRLAPPQERGARNCLPAMPSPAWPRSPPPPGVHDIKVEVTPHGGIPSSPRIGG